MPIELIAGSSRSNGFNEYYEYDFELCQDDEERIDALAEAVRDCYTKLDGLANRLPANGPLDTKTLKILIRTRIPYWVKSKKPNFQVVRSEFGEIIAQLTLKKYFGTGIHFSRLLTKEKPLLPTRGIDLLGVENLEKGFPVLVLGEAKVTCDGNSPPSAVRKKGDMGCLENRIPYLLSNRDAIIEELAYYIENVPHVYKDIYINISAMFFTDEESLVIIGLPFLLRDAKVFQASDVGNLMDHNSTSKRKVRFVLVKIKEDIDELSRLVYEKARG